MSTRRGQGGRGGGSPVALLGLVHVSWSAPYLRADARERFARLPERKAQALHENYSTSVHDYMLVGAVVMCLVGLGLSLVASSMDAAGLAAAVVLWATVWVYGDERRSPS